MKLMFSLMFLLISPTPAARAQVPNRSEATSSATSAEKKQQRPTPSPTPSRSPGPIARPITETDPPFHAHPDMLDEACYEDRSHDRADLCAQWRAALAAERAADNAATANRLAGCSLLVGLIGFIALLDNLMQMRRSNGLAKSALTDNRQIGEAQARCYLSLEELFFHIGEDDQPRLTATLRNSGASPALDLGLAAVLRYGVDGEAKMRASPGIRAPDLRVSIAPGVAMPLPHVVLDFPVNPQERAALLALAARLHVEIGLEVHCTDVFDRPVRLTVLARGEVHETERWSAMTIVAIERPVATDPS